jgi:hypothetical protein
MAMQRSVSAFAGFPIATALCLGAVCAADGPEAEGGAWLNSAVAGGQHLVLAVTPWTMNSSRVGVTDLEVT